MNKHIFITIEGMDGAGKTTALGAVSDAIADQCGEGPVVTREPGGTPLNENIRTSLLGQHGDGEKLSSLSEFLLMAGMRNHHVENTIIPSLMRGRHVLCSRFNDSMRVMQGLLGGVSPVIEELSRMPEFRFLRARPDVTFFLDVGAEQANARRERFEDHFDSTYCRNELRPENAWREHFRSVERSYLTPASFARVVRIDASQSQDKVAQEIYQHTKNLLISFENRKPLQRSYLDVMQLMSRM